MVFVRNVIYGQNGKALPPIGMGSGNITLQLAVVAEPKIRVVSAGQGDWIKECVDDKNHDLLHQGPQMPMFAIAGGARQWNWLSLRRTGRADGS